MKREFKMNEIKKNIKRGLIFQIIMLSCFLIGTTISYFEEYPTPKILKIIDLFGIAITAYYMIKIYIINNHNKLITTGFFKYTRHPMYTGFFLISLNIWYHTGNWTYPQFQITFYLSMIGFYVSLITAARFQELEVLARFGDEAKEYYKKTPRIFLLYPLCAFFRKN
jgi:protein-S-isoprenylcysteine O-methyltransferase Ste14